MVRNLLLFAVLGFFSFAGVSAQEGSACSVDKVSGSPTGGQIFNVGMVNGEEYIIAREADHVKGSTMIIPGESYWSIPPSSVSNVLLWEYEVIYTGVKGDDFMLASVSPKEGQMFSVLRMTNDEPEVALRGGLDLFDMGETVALADKNGRLYHFDPYAPMSGEYFVFTEEPVVTASVGLRGERIAYVNEDTPNIVELFDTVTGERIRNIFELDESVVGLEWAENFIWAWTESSLYRYDDVNGVQLVSDTLNVVQVVETGTDTYATITSEGTVYLSGCDVSVMKWTITYTPEYNAIAGINVTENGLYAWYGQQYILIQGR